MWQNEDFDDLRTKFLKSSQRAIVGHQGGLLAHHGVAEHPRHSGLDGIGRSVEVLANVCHKTGGEIAQGPMIINFWSGAKLFGHNASGHSGN